ncbi:unnamed protein product [Rhizoctonia solani]|uniref:Transmembrane protein n=1 Tax=Rhizoctonia solani TaxID=456999 RepID=A0A8H3GQQ6_9AGAM|nr:unnamed protein product [Rhizoctonia solani]
MFAGRLASILLFMLSLGFLVHAAGPMPRAVANRRDTGSLSQLTTLEGMTRKQLDSCMRVKTIDEAKPIIQVMISNIKSTTESLTSTGKIEVDDNAKTDIAVRMASIISLIVKILLSLSQKLGCDAIASLCGDIDTALEALLVAVNTCVEAILPLVAKKITDVKTEALLKLDLVECAKLLGFAA